MTKVPVFKPFIPSKQRSCFALLFRIVREVHSETMALYDQRMAIATLFITWRRREKMYMDRLLQEAERPQSVVYDG